MSAEFEFTGAIFDVDDTLLDNKPGVVGAGLHEKARLRAVHEIGQEHGILSLAELSAKDNLDAFLNAPVHTLQAGVWEILGLTGLASGDVIDQSNPLLLEIVERKSTYYTAILLEEGEEVPGASKFVAQLVANGLKGRLAIASNAINSDIILFLEKSKLDQYFPDQHIVTIEQITHPKPNPEIFNVAFERLGLSENDRSKTLAFEDDPRGITAAKLAGLYVCAITTRFSREALETSKTPPDLIADSYTEFAALLGLQV